jgi:hypothetical protein
MSNPVVNRLGLNLFWHQFWYSDIRYSSYVQQDMLILLLIEIYLSYGSNFCTNVFYHPYWYKTTAFCPPPLVHKHYRWASILNKVFKTLTTYRFRIRRDNVIFTRLSLLRFNSWLLVNIFWFKPNKLYNSLQTASLKSRYSNLIPISLNLQNYVLKLRALCYYTRIYKNNNYGLYQF